jgi:hypothetical protein
MVGDPPQAFRDAVDAWHTAQSAAAERGAVVGFHRGWRDAQDALASVRAHVGLRFRVERDDRESGRHRFDHGQAEALVAEGEHNARPGVPVRDAASTLDLVDARDARVLVHSRARGCQWS